MRFFKHPVCSAITFGAVIVKIKFEEVVHLGNSLILVHVDVLLAPVEVGKWVEGVLAPQ